MLSRCHYIIHCFPGELSQEPIFIRYQKFIIRLFRAETKPLKHRFEPSEQSRRTSLQLTLSEGGRLHVSHAIHLYREKKPPYTRARDFFHHLDLIPKINVLVSFVSVFFCLKL